MQGPFFLGHGLDSSEELLMDYYFQKRIRKVSGPLTPSDFASGSFYAPGCADSELREALTWNQPTVVVAGSSRLAARESFQRDLFQMGAGAVWQLPPPGRTLHFPPLVSPGGERIAFLADSLDSRSRIFRQMLLWDGYDVRMDFHSTEELEVLLSGVLEKPELLPHPILLILDLDSPRLDFLQLVELIRSIMKRSPSHRMKTRWVLMKDFARPGPGLAFLVERLRSHIRRVFHPHEALITLYEGLHLAREHAPSPSVEIPPRNLEELLLGKKPRIEALSYRSLFLEDGNEKKNYSVSRLFTWLMEYLDRSDVKSGVLLSPPEEKTR